VAVNFFEPAEKPAGEINQMDSLVNQFTATGKFRVGAPFLVITDAPAMAITRANKHQFAHHAGPENFPRLDERRMITMIEPDPDANAVLLRERNQFVNLLHGNARWFFNDDVFARADGGGGNPGQRGIDGRHDHCIHLWIGDGLV